MRTCTQQLGGVEGGGGEVDRQGSVVDGQNRPGVKDSDNCSHVLGSPNGRQASHATPNDQHLGRGHPPSCCDLASEEPAKLVCGLDYRPVTCHPGGLLHVKKVQACRSSR